MTYDVNTQAPKRLRRSKNDKMIAGVCGGWAEVLGVDAAILRILLATATLFGFGFGIVLYVICWICMPEDD